MFWKRESLGGLAVRQNLLEQIWSGAVKAAELGEASRARRILQAMVPVDVVCLKSNHVPPYAAILPEDLELMPELMLGDVIVEEMGLEVPFGALVFMRNDTSVASADDMDLMSLEIGMAVGKIGLELLGRGGLPLERENEALYIMACAYDRMARSSGMQLLGLVPEEFSRGLVSILGTYWSGSKQSRTETSGLFDTIGCLQGRELRDYLLILDPEFSAPEYQSVPAGLMILPSGLYSFPSWMAFAKDALMGYIGGSRSQLIQSEQ